MSKTQTHCAKCGANLCVTGIYDTSEIKTPEERDVLDEILDYVGEFEAGQMSGTSANWQRVVTKTIALRESRRPKPRYYVPDGEFSNVVRDFRNCGFVFARCETRADAQRVAAALNALDSGA